ncbi:MAG TPA: hypothetical protein DC027_09750 [Oscillibacter sp.]|nr:hypothetical protein [Oscillibacter sp.]
MQILRAIIAPEYIKGAYPPMQVSSAFVVVMGMGVTFVGLTCIIFLTILMGKILSKPEAPKPAAAAAAPAAPAVPADGLTDEVKVAIMAAIAQQPGFNMANVTNVSIRKI